MAEVNIIRRSGENISAAEIEEALNLDARVKSAGGRRPFKTSFTTKKS